MSVGFGGGATVERLTVVYLVSENFSERPKSRVVVG